MGLEERSQRTRLTENGWRDSYDLEGQCQLLGGRIMREPIRMILALLSSAIALVLCSCAVYLLWVEVDLSTWFPVYVSHAPNSFPPFTLSGKSEELNIVRAWIVGVIALGLALPLGTVAVRLWWKGRKKTDPVVDRVYR